MTSGRPELTAVDRQLLELIRAEFCEYVIANERHESVSVEVAKLYACIGDISRMLDDPDTAAWADRRKAELLAADGPARSVDGGNSHLAARQGSR